MKRKVIAIWKGDGADGNGVLSAQSGAFNHMPYSFKTRFENENGKLGTNPFMNKKMTLLNKKRRFF